ncbi:Six-hairpin glycosidase-like protein [Tribonema minus]|uniref:Six-hairpin glycosidase-like protein n=1 Tax=Tribonema minus TaxID=303371 RepID=A0A835YN34_9STRA|nr:Six-hairpin glycosidase-like protein [Tribonema minus]
MAARKRLDSDSDTDEAKGGLRRFVDSTIGVGTKTLDYGLKIFHWSAKYGGRTLWIVGTTTLMVVFPLMLEIEREQQIIEIEKLQVKDLLAQGVHPQRIHEMGLSLPRDPAVLSALAKLPTVYVSASNASLRSPAAAFKGLQYRRVQARFFTMSAPPGGTAFTNRLAGQTSPYLLQHAHNPVDWWPWCEEAIAKAKAESKPIFLSVGYSTCHWCHVMERESFESERVAAVLNRHFIPIKDTFIKILNTIASRWASDKEDIRRRGQAIIGQLGQAMTEESAAKGDLPALLRSTQAAAAVKSAVQALDQASTAAYQHACNMCCSHSFDDELGGFDDGGRGIKFPQPTRLDLLMRAYLLLSLPGATESDNALGKKALHMALKTLGAMAKGGINDHITGGFARYSTDPRWHVPHFEKMLYDNAQLAVSYLETYQITGQDHYRAVAESILRYVSRDMTDPLGGFYSAQDADSYPASDATAMREGAFCTWTHHDLATLLDKNEVTLPCEGGEGGVKLSHVFCKAYGVRPGGNCDPKGDPHGELHGQNVLYQAMTPQELVGTLQLQCSAEQVTHALDSAKALLYEARQQRPAPRLDDKVITAWNGLMMSAFAKAAQAVPSAQQRQEYLRTATKAAEFLQGNLFDAKERVLYRSYRAGKRSQVAAFADDHAYLIRGLLDLYDADPYQIRWLDWAEQLQEEMDKGFMADREQGGGYFSTRAGSSDVLLRLKDSQDGAEPSAMSVAASNLWRLQELVGYAADPNHSSHANMLHLLARPIQDRAAMYGMPALTAALATHLMDYALIVIVGEAGAEDTGALLQAAHSVFLPNRILILKPEGGAEADSDAAVRARFRGVLESYGGCPMVRGKATAYVCKQRVCSLPVVEPQQLVHNIRLRAPHA